MRPLALTWPAGLAFWLACSWAMYAELPFVRKTSRSKVSAIDKGSMRVLALADVGGVTLAFIVAWLVPTAAMPDAIAAYIIGITALIGGGILRRHCFRMLGAHFTFDVRVSPAQRIVSRGAYRLVRHPSYTAGLLMVGGIAVALGNWLSLAVALVPAIGAYAYRIHVEEQALLDVMGQSYVDYMKRTRRLIPFLL